MSDDLFDLVAEPTAELLPLDGSEGLRRIFSCFPTGVAALCALVDGVPVGMIASSFTAVSLSPPLVSIYMRESSETWPQLRRASSVGITVLSESQEVQCRRLATREGDRFADVGWRSNGDDTILIEGGCAVLRCTVFAEIPAGDHILVLFEIHSAGAAPELSPLVFHASRFGRLERSHDRETHSHGELSIYFADGLTSQW